MNLFKKRKNIRLQAGISLFLLAILFLTYKFRPTNSLGSISDKAKSMAQALGFQLSFDKYELTNQSLIFRNVSLKGFSNIAIKEIEAQYQLDPSKMSIVIDTINIRGLKASLALDTLIPTIQNKLKSEQSISNRKFLSDSTKIVIENTSLNIFKSQDSVDSIKTEIPLLTYLFGEGLLEGTIGKFQFKNFYDENLQFSLKKSPKNINYFLNSNKSKNEFYWSATGKIDRANLSNEVTIKSYGLPIAISEFFGNFLVKNDNQLNIIKASFPLKFDSHVPFTISLGSTNFSIMNKVIHSEVLGPFSFSINAAGNYNKSNDQLFIDSGNVKLNNKYPQNSSKSNDSSVDSTIPFSAKISGLANFNNTSKSVLVQLNSKSKNKSCSDFSSIVPWSLAPVMQDFNLYGKISYDVSVAFRLDEIENFNHTFTTAGNCEILPKIEKFELETLANRYSPYLNAASASSNELAQTTPKTFTASELMSPMFLKSLVSFEDGGFYQHDGIQLESIINAAKTNLRSKKISIGGSTITMQTAKNLFLSRERTLQRKFQEIFLSYYLESILSKKKILEIYANIIEYGPNIYGIAKASDVFFGITPEKLDIKQSAFLASILPSPISRFRYFCEGKLSKSYDNFINSKIRTMHSQNLITEEQASEAISRPLTFLKNESNAYCQQTPIMQAKSKTENSIPF